MKINKDKLDALYQHVKNDGASDLETVEGVLGVEGEEAVDAYVEALRNRNPELFGEASPTPAVEPEPFKVFLKDENNIVEELEVLSHKGNKVVTEKRVPKDLVDIILGGKTVTVDLLRLRDSIDEKYLEWPLKSVLAAAEIAKA